MKAKEALELITKADVKGMSAINPLYSAGQALGLVKACVALFPENEVLEDWLERRVKQVCLNKKRVCLNKKRVCLNKKRV